MRAYEINEEDEKCLQEYKVDIGRLRHTLRQIEQDRNLRPFDRRLPIYRSLLLKLGSLIVILAYLYVCALVL